MKLNHTFFFDTNVFIYFFEAHPIFGPKAKKFFDLLNLNQATAVTSVITQLELLSLPTTENQQLLLQHFLETPNLSIIDINQEIAIESARIRRQYQFRTPDAIQLATAIFAQVDTFVTNDKRLKAFQELKIEWL